MDHGHTRCMFYSPVQITPTKNFQCYFTGKAAESVIGTVKERILSRVLHRNAEYLDNPETSNATIVNDINQLPGALLAVRSFHEFRDFRDMRDMIFRVSMLVPSSSFGVQRQRSSATSSPSFCVGSWD